MVMEVHPPHGRVEGVKDFLVHILAITVGLLIAVGIEGLVEWQHHRHLVQDAEASLRDEIENNANALKGTQEELKREEASLQHDIDVLKSLIRTGKMPEHEHLEVGFRIHGFDSVAWKTAQATTATSYMSYDTAQKYADIYATQDELMDAERQATRDTIISLAPFVNWSDKDPTPTPAEAKAITEKIGVLEGQLMLVDSVMQSLDGSYKKFLVGNSDRH